MSGGGGGGWGVPVGAGGGVGGSCGSCGGACGLCPGSRAWRARLVLWPLCSAGGLLVVPVWAMGPFWPVNGSFRAVERRACGLCPKSSAWRAASRLPTFILLGNFRDTLLVVSILYIIYDCHL